MQVVKKLKERACKQCKTRFKAIRPLQYLCSPKCAIARVKELAEKKEIKDWKDRKREGLEKLKTKSDFENDLEREVNHIVRLIDKGHECISSGKAKYQVNAGHYYSVGANPSLRFNLFNIFNQSVADNMYRGGRPREYKEGLEKTFGYEVAEEIEGLKLKYKELHLSILELKETIKVARQCVRDLMKATKDIEKPYTIDERIELRRFYNSVLGIYF